MQAWNNLQRGFQQERSRTASTCGRSSTAQSASEASLDDLAGSVVDRMGRDSPSTTPRSRRSPY